MTDYEEFGETHSEESLPLPARRRRTTRATIAASTPAGHGARFAAALIDLVLWFLPSFAFGVALGVGATDRLDVVDLMTVAGAGWAALLLLQAILLTVRSQSIGKMALNLRIVRHDDESKPGFVRIVLVRMVVVGVINMVGNAIFPIFPFFWVDSLFVFREDRRCLHDLMAETKVISGKPGQIDLNAFD